MIGNGDDCDAGMIGCWDVEMIGCWDSGIIRMP